jgi:cellulose synthase/poly-beta-1,6-N-acetylglucosamine synthase-like glycosyltransferase
MDQYPKVGGACGEIEVFEPTEKELGYPIMEKVKKEENTEDNKDETSGRESKKDQSEYKVKKKSRNWFEKIEAKVLIYAQYVEYKVSHYIDKAFETMFGFVSVLPGAFCTFRWAAIQGDPLKSFFKGLESDKHTAKEANMYLAEDRVMWLEILRKYSEDWVLRYIPGCLALTDPPTSIIGLVKQRRRWTNGSLFASWYVLDHLNLITRSNHGWMRQTLLFILYAYMSLNFVFSLMLVGSLFASYSIFIRSNFEKSCEDFNEATILEALYAGLLIVFVIVSITKPIQLSTATFNGLVILFGIFIFISLGFGLVYFWKEQLNTFAGFLMIFTLLGVYIIPLVLNFHRLNIWKYLVGALWLMFLSPMYINIFIIYSIANLHDISWGNRDTDPRKSQDTKKNLEQFRAITLIVWIFANAVYGFSILFISQSGKEIFIFALIALVSITILGKVFIAIIHSWYNCYAMRKIK